MSSSTDDDESSVAPNSTPTTSSSNSSNLRQPSTHSPVYHGPRQQIRANKPTLTSNKKRTIGSKTRLSKDDDRLQQLYLEKCCAQNHIRKHFTVETFLSKRHEYGGIENEHQKSTFIDHLLDNAIRITTDNIAQYVSLLFCTTDT